MKELLRMATLRPADEEEAPKSGRGKEIVVRMTKCVFVLTEAELLQCLSGCPDIFERAIKRGKGYRRAAANECRQNQADRWQLYEWLKGNRLEDNAVKIVETMSAGELREGVIEYLLSLHKV